MATDPAAHAPVSAMTLDNYRFPTDKLKMRQEVEDRIPLVLVACGSFSPITILHLRMFEMASDYSRLSTQYEVVGGYLSPVSSAYKKAGLAPARDRVRMCELAADDAPSWLMVDPWEAIQPDYTPTAAVLDHFDYELNQVLGGVYGVDGESRRPVKIMLLAGADLLSTMSAPGVWDKQDLNHILGDFGAMIVERSGTDMDEALGNLKQWENNIHFIPQLIHNDVSSTKIRLLLKRGMSVKWMTPHAVTQYMNERGLYTDDQDTKSKDKGKQQAKN
ncbi:Nucleotidylyl transferase [Durotheca rogersii]|uniref:Nucleotidylyl transferase n=1 Tax=Durotheca rogersii TaxID=419775 RepID=UPI002220EB21|nr:Nucleotidylyl transferase [Durotheca rogersii]KAI5862632.1 Nucleotidylyl transferase [Durotheca rogersii]